MHKKFRISVDGRSYNVVVEELAGDFPAPIASPSPVEAAVAPVAPAVAAPPRPVAPAAARAGDELAPLAGVIDSIDVRVGQTVCAGDKIVTIEAMKMKTDVFAKHSGTVTAIAATLHDGVETGQVLISLG